MVGIGKKTLLRDVNPPLICPLCRGYLIDATTVVECLHSFCRSCILKHLRTAGHCPSCKHVLNKAKPNIKADKTLQDIVYKLVPGLYHKEMRKRREFYKMHPEQAKSATPEQRGEDVSGRLIFNPEDVVSLSLEYLPPGIDPLTLLSIKETEMNSNSNNINGGSNNNSNNSNNNNNSNHLGNTASNRRYLQCPALVTIAHLKKFVAMKYSVDVTRYTIEICHLAPLPENWTLMDVAYIYAWKRIAPMRFFYRVAQEEQRLEAPVHHRPSTPGLGARDCLPPNDTPTDDSNVNSEVVNHQETSKSEVKAADDNETTSLTKDSTRITSDETSSSVSRKQIIEKNETSKISTESVKPPISTSTSNLTHATLPTTSTSPSPGTNTSSFSGTNTSSSTTTCNDSNRQIKSPIKILKNSDGRYEVLKNLSSTADTSEKGQTAATANVKCPANPEFSVVNSNGVKITLKQCSPLQQQSNSSKKPKIISNTLLRPAPTDKDAPPMSAMAVLQQLQQQQKQQEKEKLSTSPPSMDKQEKQRRKVTFVDRLSTSEKSSPSATVPKTALKKPAEQQDKKQFLQSFQLTARETPLPDDKLKSPVRDTDVTASAAKCLQNSTAMSKVGEFSKKDADEVKKKNNTENTNLTVNNSTANTVTNKRTVSITSAGTSARTHTSKADGADGRSFNSGTSLNSGNIASGNHTAKIDVYTFPNDPIVPAGAVKRKCPPGVPIADLKRQKSQQIVQKAEVKRKQNVSQYNPTVKLPRISPKEHAIPTSRATAMAGDHSGGPSRTSNAHNAKTSTSPLLSNETRDILMDGYGLNIPASLSITLTSPKSPGTSGQFIEPSDSNDNDGRKITLNKMNPSITLNNRSLDPRVLKALKTGQIKMPTSPPKAKSPVAAPMTVKQTPTPTDRSEISSQQRTTTMQPGKRKKEQESSRDILDLSGGNKKVDMHPLRIPQPVTKLNKSNKAASSKDSMQLGDISDQGQVVTLMGGHRYYRAPPGSLTPAAHRVNDCPLPSRTPVYAPSFGSINRSSSDLSSVFPSLPSLYALHQATNLQQYHHNLRLPSQRPATERDLSATRNNSSISGITGKSHLAAQCAPIKPARSSMASLAVPIGKQQSTDKFVANTNANRTASSDAKKLPAFRNNESLDSTDETSHMIARKRYLSSVESTNNRFSPGNNKDAKSNDQTTVESKTKDSNVESIDINNSKQQQQQQHRETTSPNVVSSTASPSPPPSNSGVNVRSESSARQGDSVSNVSNEDATLSPTKSNVNTEVTCSKSPVSPDSSSITIESSGVSKSCSTSTDRESTEVQTSSNVVKDPTGFVNPDDSVADDSTTSDDKGKFDKPEVNEITKQLLAVFPSKEWAKNPVAAEHLDNFFKSLNAMKNEESKADKIDRKAATSDSPVKSKKDFVERS